MKTHATLAALVAAFLCPLASAATPAGAALEVVSMQEPAFPFPLTQRGVVTGETEAVVSIGADGKIADWLVTAYTDPAFERMTGELLSTMVCKPLGSREHPGPARLTLRFYFEATGVVVSQTVNDTVSCLITRMTSHRRIEKMGTLRELDQILSVRHAVSPRYPATAGGQAGARITLEFFVDETGRVRMPVMHQGENWLLADAAATALLDWQFTPPTRHGQPVIVAARQEFIFGPQP